MKRYSGTIRKILLLILAAPLLLTGYAFLVEPNLILVHSVNLQMHTLPKELDGLSVALISDMHIANTPESLGRAREIVRKTNQLSPDLILLLGDYMGNSSRLKNSPTPTVIAQILADLRANYGVFAVLGNHDWWHDGEWMRKAFLSHKIPVLENSCRTISIRGKMLNIVGLPDGTRYNTIRNGFVHPDNDAPTIVMMHMPEFFALSQPPGELSVAGHTHGGQVVIPWYGALLGESPCLNKYWAGLMRDSSGNQLFITRGTGTTNVPIRFCAPPEIVLLRLHPKTENASASQAE